MITLEPFEKKDFGGLIAWVDSEETLVQFAGTLFSFPLTAEQLDQYIADQNRYSYKVLLPPLNVVIGHAEIYLSDSSAFLCRILIGKPEYRGNGLGLQIVQSLLRIAFTELRTEKVELNVFDWNIPAIRCYEKAGFVISPGIKRSRMVKGQKWTTLNMCLRKIDWTPV